MPAPVVVYVAAAIAGVAAVIAFREVPFFPLPVSYPMLLPLSQNTH